MDESVSSEFDLNKLVRKEVLDYVFENLHKIDFDKNESAISADNIQVGDSLFSPALREFPSIKKSKLTAAVSKIKGIPQNNILVGSDTEHFFDLFIRCFCNPGKDNIISFPNGDDKLSKLALLHTINHQEIPLNDYHEIDLDKLSDSIDESTKLIFLSSPNSATGKIISLEELELLVNNFQGLVIVDESFVNFSRSRSFIRELLEYPNLFILQSLSQAWELAGLGLGFLFGGESVLKILQVVSNPSQVNTLTENYSSEVLLEFPKVNERISKIVSLRNKLITELSSLTCVKRVFNSDANFVLVEFEGPWDIYPVLMRSNVSVVDFSKNKNFPNCLQIKINADFQIQEVIEILRQVKIKI